MTQQAPTPDVQRVVTAGGEELYMTPDEAAAGVRQGLVSFVGQVPIRDDAGELHLVDADTANQQIAGTYTGAVGGLGAFEKQQEAKEFDTLGSKAAAFGIGAGNALTLGFGRGLAVDLAQAEDKAAVRRYLAAQEEHNAAYGTAGEVAGFLAPALLSGGTSAAASGAARGAGLAGRVATAAPRGLATLAEFGGELAPRALGLAEGGVAARALGAGTRGAIEMVPYSVGDAYSRARIEDRDLTSEQLVAAAGHGALMGGAFGGGLSLLGSAGARAMRGAGELVTSAAPRVEALAEKLGVGVPSLSKIEQEHVIKTLAGSNGAKLVKEIGQWTPELQSRLTNIVQTEVPKKLGKDSLMGASRGEIAGALKEVRKDFGNAYESAITDMDQAVAKHAVDGVTAKELRPSLDTVVERARADVLSPLMERLPSWEQGQAREIEKIVKGLAEDSAKSGGATFAELNRASQSVTGGIVTNPQRIAGFTLEERAVNDARKALKEVIEAEFERAGESLAQKEGAEFSVRWADAKANYKAARNAELLAREGATAEAKNNAVGLGAMIAGGTAANIGSGIGGAIAGPVGAMAGSALGGLAGAVVGSAVKRHGNQVVASLARSAIETDIVRAITSKVEGTTAAQVTQFLAKKVPNLAPTMALAERTYEGTKRTAQREYEERHKALVQFRANPQAILATTTKGAPDDVRQQLQAKTIQVAEYLASKAPKPLGGNPLMPQADPGRVDPAQRDKWLRAARAADDPASIVADMRSGRLTPEAVDAVKTLYPRMYGQITGQIEAELAARSEPLSYSQATQLRVLLGVPVDVSQKPEYLGAVQHLAPVTMPAPPITKAALSEPANVAKTGSQKLEENKE